ncbi:MAG: RluA family pseudouridine synthase [Planctomycetota bacterium]
MSDAGAEDRASVSGLAQTADVLTKGGKVDPDAVRAAIELARAAGNESASIEVSFTLQRDLKARLDKYLTSRVTFMSRSQLQRLIAGGGVRVNARPAKASQTLRLNDTVSVVVPPPPSGEVMPEDIPLDVLFEDEHLIVLNKRPDIIVHPARSELGGTMINALAWRFQKVSGGALSEVGKDYARPGVVHRLDRHTSGCIVFAKEDETHWKLGRQFEERTVDKRYLAVVHGSVEPNADVIEAPIGSHPSKEKGYREKQVVRHDDLGKPAVTIARVRERYRDHDRPVGDQDFTLVELELKTGRTHQIRVHLSYRGYPIVGDDMYGGRRFVVKKDTLIDRQSLHAALLAFEHPLTGGAMAFTAPLREDMLGLIKHLRTTSVEAVHVEGTVPLTRFGL